MLKQRVITGVLMALVFLVILFFLPRLWFGVCFGLVLAVGMWEWSDLSALGQRGHRAAYVALSVVVAVACAWFTDWATDVDAVRTLLVGSCLWWALALLWIQGFPSSALLWGSRPVRLLMGLLVFVPAWIAALYLSAEASGPWLVFFVVLLVSAADIGAYFVGRRFGRHKLAPKVSPGKTWEGVFGGAAFATLAAVAFNFAFGGHSWLPLILVALPAALMSVVGDLLESMIKRHRGVKDSSALLPGHGGVLDRIDGMVAATPVFTLMFIVTSWRI